MNLVKTNIETHTGYVVELMFMATDRELEQIKQLNNRDLEFSQYDDYEGVLICSFLYSQLNVSKLSDFEYEVMKKQFNNVGMNKLLFDYFDFQTTFFNILYYFENNFSTLLSDELRQLIKDNNNVINDYHSFYLEGFSLFRQMLIRSFFISDFEDWNSKVSKKRNVYELTKDEHKEFKALVEKRIKEYLTDMQQKD